MDMPEMPADVREYMDGPDFSLENVINDVFDDRVVTVVLTAEEYPAGGLMMVGMLRATLRERHGFLIGRSVRGGAEMLAIAQIVRIIR